MPLEITRAIYDKLGFDLNQAVADFAAAKKAHASTVDVPAPTAHPIVEEALRRGGYVIVEPEPKPEATTLLDPRASTPPPKDSIIDVEAVERFAREQEEKTRITAESYPVEEH